MVTRTRAEGSDCATRMPIDTALDPLVSLRAARFIGDLAREAKRNGDKASAKFYHRLKAEIYLQGRLFGPASSALRRAGRFKESNEIEKQMFKASRD